MKPTGTLRRIIARIIDRYPFPAKPVRIGLVRPENVPITVYGDHGSYVRDGHRHFRFLTDEARKAFEEKYK